MHFRWKWETDNPDVGKFAISSKIAYAFSLVTNTSHFQASISDTIQTGIRRDFPGHPVVKIPPSEARMQIQPPSQETEILHAAGRLSLCTTRRDAFVLLGPCSATREATAMKSPRARTREQPLLATTRDRCAAMKTQRSQNK